MKTLGRLLIHLGMIKDILLYFLFLFFFYYHSLKQFLSALMQYYSNVSLNDPVVHNIFHNKIFKTDDVYKDACGVIITLKAFAKEQIVTKSAKRYSKIETDLWI
jgi:hypothetical protein